jgi:hypothetical protein
MKIRLLSSTNAPLSRGVVGDFQSLPLDSYTLKKAGNCNLIWILMGGDESRLTRSGNCGLQPLECNVAFQIKRILDFRGLEPQRPSSAAFLISAVNQGLSTVVYIFRTNFLRLIRL